MGLADYNNKVLKMTIHFIHMGDLSAGPSNLMTPLCFLGFIPIQKCPVHQAFLQPSSVAFKKVDHINSQTLL